MLCWFNRSWVILILLATFYGSRLNLYVTKNSLPTLTGKHVASYRVLASTMWMQMGLGSQEICSPLAVGKPMPTGSWIVAIGLILALKRLMNWAAGLLFMPLTETAILEVLSTVRDQCYHTRGWGGKGDLRLGELEGTEW